MSIMLKFIVLLNDGKTAGVEPRKNLDFLCIFTWVSCFLPLANEQRPQKTLEKVILEAWKCKRGLGRTPWSREEQTAHCNSLPSANRKHWQPGCARGHWFKSASTFASFQRFLVSGPAALCSEDGSQETRVNGKEICFIQGQASWDDEGEFSTSELHLREFRGTKFFYGERKEEQGTVAEKMVTLQPETSSFRECIHAPPLPCFCPQFLRASSCSYFEGIFHFCKLNLSTIYIIEWADE